MGICCSVSARREHALRLKQQASSIEKSRKRKVWQDMGRCRHSGCRVCGLLCGRKEPAIWAEGSGYGGPGRGGQLAVGG